MILASILGSWKASAHTSVRENKFDPVPIGESIFGIWIPPTDCYRNMIISIKYKDIVDWCDFGVWCPTAFLVQRINLDLVWRSTTLFLLHRLYEWNILRNEDRTNRNLLWPPPGAEEVDLDILFSADPTQNHVRSLFIYCLAVHLGRWIYHSVHSNGNREECCRREHYLAKEKFCCLCFLRYFLFRWETDNPSSPLSPLVAKIRTCKWRIPDRLWEDAKRRLLTLTFSPTTIQPPCMSCKF